MKRAVSISLGSSKRDKSVTVDLGGQEILVERIGTDGDVKKARQMYHDLDGKVDAFGVGGVDLYLRLDDREYPLYGERNAIIHVKLQFTVLFTDNVCCIKFEHKLVLLFSHPDEITGYKASVVTSKLTFSRNEICLIGEVVDFEIQLVIKMPDRTIEPEHDLIMHRKILFYDVLNPVILKTSSFRS